jgi:hypothetical protein
VLSVAGAITGNKDLQRVGAIVGIVGGASSLIGGSTGAVTAAGEGASAGDAINGMDLASDQANAAAGGNIAGSGSSVITPENGQPAWMGDQGGNADPTAATGDSIMARATQQAGQAVSDPTQVGQTTNLADVAPPDPSLMERATAAAGGTSGQNVAQITTPTVGQPGSLGQVAQQYTADDLKAWFSKMGDSTGKLGKFVKDNKELVGLTGDILKMAYNPAAEAFDYNKSLMERAYRNYNAPVVLGQVKKG